jgi:hypothetical protein
LGSASALVQGPEIGEGDNGASLETQPFAGVALGLDD